jgi:hypothetical protein
LTKKTPYKGPGADSEEKHEPASDTDIAVVDSLKVLDPKWPIREAVMLTFLSEVSDGPRGDVARPGQLGSSGGSGDLASCDHQT